MIQAVIARRYARSLIAMAQECGKLDAFGSQLSAFMSVCRQNPSVLLTLSNRFFDMLARERIVDDIAGRLGCDILVTNFIKLMIRKGRIAFLQGVCDEYLAVANQLQNRCEMIVESATEMSDAQYDSLSQVFGAKTGKTVILRKKMKPELLGGARVVIGGRVYDYSVQHQMDVLQNLLMRD